MKRPIHLKIIHRNRNFRESLTESYRPTGDLSSGRRTTPTRMNSQPSKSSGWTWCST